MDTSQTFGLTSDPSFSVRGTRAERLFAALLSKLEHGRLQVRFPSGYAVLAGKSGSEPVRFSIVRPGFFRKVISGGSVGFGEAFVDGDWTTDDLTGVLKVLGQNQGEMGRLPHGLSFLNRTANRIFHLARRNTVGRSRRNISEHYDLSNAFYQTFLDPSLSYSSAIFANFDEALESAQMRKIDRLLDLAGIKQGDSVLEIGSGWGALAIRAVQTRACRVKTITLSEEQHSLASRRVAEAGLEDRIEVALEDYRIQSGRYDAILSCEMIEAVGHEFLDAYFGIIRDCLKPGGRAAIQAITIPDERYDRYRRGCDWIRKHIFPGGHLPSPGALDAAVSAVGGLRLESATGFGTHYAETLRRWRAAFNCRGEEVAALGFDERFKRKWNYYLSYCEAGFDTGMIDVEQRLYFRH